MQLLLAILWQLVHFKICGLLQVSTADYGQPESLMMTVMMIMLVLKSDGSWSKTVLDPAVSAISSAASSSSRPGMTRCLSAGARQTVLLARLVTGLLGLGLELHAVLSLFRK